MRRSALRDLFQSIALSAISVGAGCASDALPGPQIDAFCQRFDLDIPIAFPTGGACGRYVPIDGGMPDGPYDCLGPCGWPGDPDPHRLGQLATCEPIEVCGYHGVLCQRCGPGGRRPPGLAPPATTTGPEMGVLFARMAHLEAASIPAFRRIARELLAFGAPRALVEAARDAARDEIRHARLCTALARRHGVAPPRAVIAPTGARTLLAFAADNAVEGCAREGFGALLATFQSHAAEDAEVRATMTGIAEDETRHAELAWAIDAWAAEQLTEEQRHIVASARARALHELAHELVPAPATLRAAAGLPDRAASLQLLAGLHAAIAQLSS